MLKLGFAGFRHGHIFSLYEAAKTNENVEIVAAWEEYEEAKEGAKKNYSVNFTHQSYEDMLTDDNIDAIAIGNYYGARGQMAIAALKAGKHVISDKPLCTSLDELKEIEKLSKEKGLSVGLMLDMRDNKNVLAAKEIIESGRIGEVYNIQFGGQHPLNYGVRPGWYFEKGKHGGVINDIAIHGIDLISYITGLEIKNIVAARTWNAYATEEPEFKDCGQFMLELSNGGGVIADISYASPNSMGLNLPYYWEFKVWGSKGMMLFAANIDGVKLYVNGSLELENVPGICPKDDYLDGFVNEINGKPTRYGTKTAIHSTEMTLSIQQKANL